MTDERSSNTRYSGNLMASDCAKEASCAWSVWFRSQQPDRLSGSFRDHGLTLTERQLFGAELGVPTDKSGRFLQLVSCKSSRLTDQKSRRRASVS